MESNEVYSLLTNVSEEEGFENLNISDLSPNLGPNFHNQVKNHLVFLKNINYRCQLRIDILESVFFLLIIFKSIFSFGLWFSLWFF